MIITIRPSDLPEVRAKAVAARETEAGRAYAIQANMHETFGMKGISHEQAEHYAAAERATLREATLYHVSDEMSRLAVLAADSITEFHLRPWDTPAPVGLIWFDHPISPGRDRLLPLRAASWCITALGKEVDQVPADGERYWHDESGDIWAVAVTFYGAPAEHPLGGHLAQRVGQLAPEYDRLVPFGDATGVSPSTSIAWRALVSAWLLMSQRVADVADLTLPPKTARKYARRGYNRAPVRVVTLAPPKDGGEPRGDAAAREYRHRWMVRGHWRNQWFPKQQRHVPMWIAPYIKGPDGAPILAPQEVVHAWK